MKMKFLILALVAAGAWAQVAAAQNWPSPLSPQMEKELAAHASDVTEVTMNKSMLGFAAKFMNGKNHDDAAVRQLIQGLEGIYIREYEFEKEGQYSQEILEKLRLSFASPEWSTLVKEHDRKHGETTEVLVKLVNGENHGLFVLNSEPRELSIVVILGPIRLEDLGKLKHMGGMGGALSGLSGLSGMQGAPRGNRTGGSK